MCAGKWQGLVRRRTRDTIQINRIGALEYFIKYLMMSRLAQDGRREVIPVKADNPDKEGRDPQVDSDSEDSDEDGVGTGKLPDFVDLNEAGQSEPLRFLRLSDSTAIELRHNGICPFCAQKCSQPICESEPTSLGCRFRAHLYCVLTLELTTYKIRGYPKGLSAANLELGTVFNKFSEATPSSCRASAGLIISHPLTNLTYVALEKRMSVQEKPDGNRFLSWSLIKENNSTQRGYEPNYVCLPYADFRLELEVDLSLSDKPMLCDFVVVFNPDQQVAKKCTMFAKSGPVTIEMDIYITDFKPILSLMNYKYKYPDSPLIVIKTLIYELQPPAPFIPLPHPVLSQVPEHQPMTNPLTPQFYKAKSEQGNFHMYSFENAHPFLNHQPYPYMPAQAFSVYSQDYVSHSSVYNVSNDRFGHPVYTAYDSCSSYGMSHPQHLTAQSINYKVEESGGESSPTNQANALNHKQVREMIENGQLKVQASTNTGSRQLQKYLRKCSTEEVEEVLSCIQDDLEEFVTNDYANYMLQSLVNACNVEQRTRIVVKLSKRMADLSRNKKGTHCLQALITKVLTPKQFKIVISSIEKQFIRLCEELNSAHFLLKIISSFPVEQLQSFYVEMLQPKSFLHLSQNQNAVLVVKAFMQKVAGIDKMQRVFVMLIANDLDTIIQDPFGNYVVQHAYEIYKQQVNKQITQKIIKKITQYSVQKFSSCVVEKCVNLYFNEIQGEILKSVCENMEALEEMLKFSVASNILQRIVKRNKTHPVVSNICKILSLPRMSKYGAGWDHILYQNKEKAATCRNSQGGNFTSFTQAVQHREKGKQPSKKGSKTPNLKN